MSGMHSLNHTAMPVSDMQAAEAFYRDVLGATPHGCTCFAYEDVKTGAAIFKSYVIGDFLLALTVARNRMDMPPADQFRGAHGFRHGRRPHSRVAAKAVARMPRKPVSALHRREVHSCWPKAS